MLFCKDYRDQVAAEVGSAAPNIVSKALGERWGQTTDRHTWEKQAEKDRVRYDREKAAHDAMLDEEAAGRGGCRALCSTVSSAASDVAG